ncbi:MAG: hypothetical protein PF637_08490 [Spirochaetes bacterium]|nr:hypothetical protein [Spirochaetota bacterium]
MKKAVLTVSVLLFMVTITIITADDWGDTNASFADISLVMEAYGFAGIVPEPDSPFMSALKSDIARQVGAFEKSPAIDTAAEFLTAALFSDLLPQDPEKQETVIQHLSFGSAGARKIAAIWFEKSATSGISFDEPVNYIAKKADVPKESLHYFYRAAITDKIAGIAAQSFKDAAPGYFTYPKSSSGGSKDEHVVAIITRYFCYPTKENFSTVSSAVNYFGRKGTTSQRDMAQFRILVSFLEKLSPQLRKRITAEL